MQYPKYKRKLLRAIKRQQRILLYFSLTADLNKNVACPFLDRSLKTRALLSVAVMFAVTVVPI